MDNTITDVEVIQQCINEILGAVDSVRNDVQRVASSIKSLNESFVLFKGYDGQIMEDRMYEEEVVVSNIAGTAETRTITYGYRASLQDKCGNDNAESGVGRVYAHIDHLANEIYRDLHSIEQSIDYAIKATASIKKDQAEVTAGLLGDYPRSKSSGGGGGSSGGGGAYSGGYVGGTVAAVTADKLASSLNANTSKKSNITEVKPSTDSNGNQTTKEKTNDTTKTSKNDNSTISNNSSVSVKEKKSVDSSKKDKDSKDSKSGYSGGGYSATSGYYSDDEKTQDNSGIKSSTNSVDDIIKGKNKKIPYSGVSGFVGSVTSGSTVIPVASGLGATAATGAGFAFLMGRKKDDEDEENKEDSGLELQNIEIQNKNDDKEDKRVVSSADELEEYGNSGEEDDSFRESEINSNKEKELEKNNSIKSFEDAKKSLAEDI